MIVKRQEGKRSKEEDGDESGFYGLIDQGRSIGTVIGEEKGDMCVE